MSNVFDDAQTDYLNAHKWAVLATGRKDGSPQISQIGYHYDGADIVVSIKSYTAKWKNALRQPRVALLVHDDRKQLIIYGTAECIDQDPERAELSARVFRALSSNEVIADEKLVARLDEQQRTVLRITPEKAFMNE